MINPNQPFRYGGATPDDTYDRLPQSDGSTSLDFVPETAGLPDPSSRPVKAEPGHDVFMFQPPSGNGHAVRPAPLEGFVQRPFPQSFTR